MVKKVKQNRRTEWTELFQIKLNWNIWNYPNQESEKSPLESWVFKTDLSLKLYADLNRGRMPISPIILQGTGKISSWPLGVTSAVFDN